MASLEQVLSVLDVEPTGDARFAADSVSEGAGQVVFGGQLLGQSIMAASRTVPDMQVLSLQTVFLRGASLAEPLAIDVELLHTGRSFSTAAVSVRQGDRLCVRSTALLHAPDDDIIRHQAHSPAVTPPGDLLPTGDPEWWDIRVVDGVDLRDPDIIGPANLQVWSRVPGAPADVATNQALLAYATDGFLIGTAMRPHAGVGQALAHVTISTTVLAHNLTFHEAFMVDEWLLIDQRSTAAGRGRSHGLGEVFTREGRLVCSFSQESMIRDMPAAQRPTGDQRARF
jgi:acyl-CoA thioesterase